MIEPLLDWIVRGGIAASGWPARRMGFDFVRRAEHDVDTAAIGLPAWNQAPGEVPVGVSYAPIVFGLELVFRSARRGIAAQPELFDEMVALRIGPQALERGALPVFDDVDHIFFEPLGVGRDFRLRRWRLVLRRDAGLPGDQRASHGHGQNAGRYEWRPCEPFRLVKQTANAFHETTSCCCQHGSIRRPAGLFQSGQSSGVFPCVAAGLDYQIVTPDRKSTR